MQLIQTAIDRFKLVRDVTSLKLIEDLCLVFERRLSDVEDNTAETLRIIQAVATRSKILLHPESFTTKVLTEEFNPSSLLWKYVSVADHEE